MPQLIALARERKNSLLSWTACGAGRRYRRYTDGAQTRSIFLYAVQKDRTMHIRIQMVTGKTPLRRFLRSGLPPLKRPPLSVPLCCLCLLLAFVPPPAHGQDSGAAAGPSGRAFCAFDDLVLIGLGDSMTHGTMNATNNATNSLNAYLQRVADALGRVAGVSFSQPFFDTGENRMAPFTIPTNLGVDGADLFSLEGKEYYKRAGTPESERVSYYLCDKILPWRLEDNYDRVLYPINLLAGSAVSQLDAAVWLLNQAALGSDSTRSIVLLWIGNNESSSAALGYGAREPQFFPLPFDAIADRLKPGLRYLMWLARQQGLLSFDPYRTASIEATLTEIDDFSLQYAGVLDRLERAVPEPYRRADVFVCTLPYYSSVGYLMDSGDLEYYLQKVNPDYRVPPGFAKADWPNDPASGDRVSLMTFLSMLFLLGGADASVDEVNRILDDDGLVLSEDEQLLIQERIDAYNNAIREIALQGGDHVHLIDTGRYLNEVLTGAVSVTANGMVLNRRWMRGNSFTLDGVHPGHTAQAFIANCILRAVNDTLGLAAPLYDLGDIIADDPYADHDGDGWVPGPDYDAPGFSEILCLVRDPDDADPSVGPGLTDDVWNKISDVLVMHIFR